MRNKEEAEGTQVRRRSAEIKGGDGSLCPFWWGVLFGSSRAPQRLPEQQRRQSPSGMLVTLSHAS